LKDLTLTRAASQHRRLTYEKIETKIVKGGADGEGGRKWGGEEGKGGFRFTESIGESPYITHDEYHAKLSSYQSRGRQMGNTFAYLENGDPSLIID
jgi:hypothetical protein